MIDHDFARALADTVGMNRLIAAVDSRAGRVCIHGWKTMLPLTAVQAVQLLEGYCDEFLYTHVDKEGLMQGTDMAAIKAVAKATERKSPPPAASPRGRKSTPSTPWASMRWSAWPSTPGRLHSTSNRRAPR